MNWNLKGAHENDIKAFLNGDHADILAEGLERFAPQLGTVMDLWSWDGRNLGPDPIGPQENYTEYPDRSEGPFVWDGPSYRMNLNVGFYRNGKFVSLKPTTYDMQVIGGNREGLPKEFLRMRKIKEVYPIQ